MLMNFPWMLSLIPVPEFFLWIFFYEYERMLKRPAVSSSDGSSQAMPSYMKLIHMETNKNTVPEDITQILHQTACWQVCWWSQTRLHVETQLLFLTFWTSVRPSLLTYFQALKFCLLSPRGWEAERPKEWKTENLADQREWNMSRFLRQQD